MNGTFVSRTSSGVFNFTFTYPSYSSSSGQPFPFLIVNDILWFNEWGSFYGPLYTSITGAVASPSLVAATSVNLTVTSSSNFNIGDNVIISGVQGMIQLNGNGEPGSNTYKVSDIPDATHITIKLKKTTKLTAYTSGGVVQTTVDSENDNTINGVSGVVTAIVNAATGTYQVTFTDDQTVGGTGIAQMMTNSLPSQDGIKWYDGDPTNSDGIPSITGLGWVNFAPPLTQFTININDQQAALYYLVGALMIVPFKDRIVFFGPQIQTSTALPIQKPLQDTVIWSWNGTPYYSDPVPTNVNSTETFDVSAYYVDQAGHGGYLSAGISKPIVTAIPNEDVILTGFGGTGKKTRFVYTGNDLQPFLFYLINSELPSNSTFSSIIMDRGGIEIGQYGITLTTQQSCQRIDLDIPDEVFKIQALNNGQDRVNAVRDFYREWIYFSYPTKDGKESNGSWKYPSNSFMYNYRDNTWAILRENFTHHGSYRKSSHYTGKTLPFKTWATWREPWGAGSSVALFPNVIAGNPQGFVLVKDENTGEAPSGYISNIITDAGGSGYTQIVSVNHCVNNGNQGAGGNGDYLNFGGSIALVTKTIDANNFLIDIPFPSTATIIGATKATKAVITLKWVPAQTPPAINSYFVGQQISISGVVGMIELNGNTYTVLAVTSTTVTLNVDSTGFTTYISGGTTTLVDYIGLGTYARLCQPLIQTKQFPVYWEQGRKVRLGVQKYLLNKTARSQITVNINLSQDPLTAYNEDPEVPSNNVTNSSLIYSRVVYTCPESTNLGLTAANVNLQMPTASRQDQIWHRMNTSLIGDSFQISLTLSDAQMRNLEYATSDIVLYGMQFDVNPGPLLS